MQFDAAFDDTSINDRVAMEVRSMSSADGWGHGSEISRLGPSGYGHGDSTGAGSEFSDGHGSGDWNILSVEPCVIGPGI